MDKNYKYLVIVQGDWNDADYVYKHNLFTADEIDKVKELVEMESVIKEVTKMAKFPGNWPHLGELVNAIEDFDEEDDNIETTLNITKEMGNRIYDFYENYMPWGYECRCHSLESITVYTLADEQTDFNI